MSWVRGEEGVVTWWKKKARPVPPTPDPTRALAERLTRDLCGITVYGDVVHIADVKLLCWRYISLLDQLDELGDATIPPRVTPEDFEKLKQLEEEIHHIEAEDNERRRRLGIE